MIIRSARDKRLVAKDIDTIYSWTNDTALDAITELGLQVIPGSVWKVIYSLLIESVSVNSDFKVKFDELAEVDITWGASFDAITAPWKAVSTASSPGTLMGKTDTRTMGGVAGVWGVIIDSVIAFGTLADPAGIQYIQCAPNSAVAEATLLLGSSCMTAIRVK